MPLHGTDKADESPSVSFVGSPARCFPMIEYRKDH